MNYLSAMKSHRCHLCDKHFNKKYNLQRHVDAVHADKESTTDEDEHYDHEIEDSSRYEHYEPSFKKRRVEESEDVERESSQGEDSESEFEGHDSDSEIHI